MSAFRSVATLCACVALVAAGCSSTTAPAPSALKRIDPAAFQATVAAAAKPLLVPGTVVVVRTPEGNFTAAAGTTQLGADTPPTPDTHFRIASNTKTMTSALIVLLAQDGKLRFSDPISAYVPDVPDGAHITIADLLTMRSGLYGYTGAPEFAATLDSDPAKVWTPQEVLAVAFRHPPLSPPNTAFDYSNTNYALLGLVAEKVAERPLAEQFQDRLFRPLGLQQTSLPAAGDTSLPAPYSHGYMYGGSAYAMVDQEYPADMQAAAKAGTLKPVDYTNQNSSYATAAGGVISTANDLATWIKALVAGHVLNADYQKQWLASLQIEDPGTPDGRKYGYGIEHQRFGPNASMYYHFGELPGFNSFMGYDTENDVTLVIWTNLTVAPDGRTTAQALLPTVLNEIYAGLSL